jgi:preprotein translocase subunit YajC
VGGGNNPLGTVLLLAAIALLVVAFTRSRRRQRETVSVQQRLTPGSQVMTTSGLFAVVVAVEDAAVTLETGPGQRSRWDKRAVARILPGPDEAADPARPADPPERVQDAADGVENTDGVDLGKPAPPADDEEHPPGRE